MNQILFFPSFFIWLDRKGEEMKIHEISVIKRKNASLCWTLWNVPTRNQVLLQWAFFPAALKRLLRIWWKHLIPTNPQIKVHNLRKTLISVAWARDVKATAPEYQICLFHMLIWVLIDTWIMSIYFDILRYLLVLWYFFLRTPMRICCIWMRRTYFRVWLHFQIYSHLLLGTRPLGSWPSGVS